MMSPRTEDIEIRLLLEAVFQNFHYDFRRYAMASIKRRVLVVKDRLGCSSISVLQDKLLHDPAAFPAFLALVTVPVSELFRDPLYFKMIREKVLPHLRTYPSLKIWIAGCGSGEELYSFAIMLREEGLENKTILYATDINPEALKQAQAGVYRLDRMQLFANNYWQAGGKSSLSDYYTAAYGAAKFDKTLRDRTVFSDHSLVSDQVFSEVHQVSCRNVLIYFNRELQDRALLLFKDALIRRGFLGLGAKESLRFSECFGAFSEFSAEERLYQKL